MSNDEPAGPEKALEAIRSIDPESLTPAQLVQALTELLKIDSIARAPGRS